MMNPIVDRNLAKFCNFLNSCQIDALSPRRYRALLDLETGEMKFATTLRSLKDSLSQDRKRPRMEEWGEIQIQVTGVKGNKPVFEVTGLENLSEKVKEVVHQMLGVLNNQSEEVKMQPDALPERALLNAIEEGRLPGWIGRKSRSEAEAILKAGTYAIRESSEEDSMLKELRSNRCYFLIFTIDGEQFSERMIVKTEKGWILYNDETRLDTYATEESPRRVIEDFVKARALSPCGHL